MFISSGLKAVEASRSSTGIGVVLNKVFKIGAGKIGGASKKEQGGAEKVRVYLSF
jgi:hypothetical protein